MRASRVILFLWVIVWFPPAYASADWILSPFIGLKMGGDTNFVDLDQGAGATKLTLGGSAGLLGDGVLGVEADFGYSPRFFETATRARLVFRSSVTTLMGNVTPPDVTTLFHARPTLSPRNRNRSRSSS